MNHWELTRMVCYSVAAPALLYVALFDLRNRMFASGIFYLAISLLFCWYLFDLTLVAAGVNEREIRWIATPITIVAAGAALWMAFNASRICRLMYLRRTRHVSNTDRRVA